MITMVSVIVAMLHFPVPFLRLTTYNRCIYASKTVIEGNKIVVLVPFKLFFFQFHFYLVLAKAILVWNRSTMALIFNGFIGFIK
jgi:hypothetical protein